MVTDICEAVDYICWMQVEIIQVEELLSVIRL